MSPVIQVVLALLQTIAGIAAGKTSNANVGMLLGLVTDAIQLGDSALAALTQLNTEIKAMVAAGTDPTQADWDSLKARSDAAHAAIQNS